VPILVPVERLSSEALLGLVDDFVLREGTDYGHDDPTLESKRRDVMRQIEDGEVVVVFDPERSSATLVRRRDLPPG
jgi:uncharacterized protein YheU (UPF0270 family)